MGKKRKQKAARAEKPQHQEPLSATSRRSSSMQHAPTIVPHTDSSAVVSVDTQGTPLRENGLKEILKQKKVFKAVRFNLANTLVLRYFPMTSQDAEAADTKLSKHLENRKGSEEKKEDEAVDLASGCAPEQEVSEDDDDIAGLILPGNTTNHPLKSEELQKKESGEAELLPLPSTDSNNNFQEELNASDVELLLTHKSVSRDEFRRITLLNESLEEQLRTTEEELDEITDAMEALESQGGKGTTIGEHQVVRRKQSIDAMLDECEQLKEQVKMYQFLSTAQSPTAPEQQGAEAKNTLKSRVRDLEREVRSLEKELAQAEDTKKELTTQVKSLKKEAEVQLQQQARVLHTEDSDDMDAELAEGGPNVAVAEVPRSSSAQDQALDEDETLEDTRKIMESLVGELRKQVTEEVKDKLRVEIRAELLAEMEQAVVGKIDHETTDGKPRKGPHPQQVSPVHDEEKEVSEVSIHISSGSLPAVEKTTPKSTALTAPKNGNQGGWLSCCWSGR